jgi:general secretion pathway protein G
MIELTVVIALLMILAAMGIAQYRNSVAHAREAVLKQDLFGMRDAIDQYYADKGQYPSTLDALASDGYVRSIPKPASTT